MWIWTPRGLSLHLSLLPRDTVSGFTCTAFKAPLWVHPPSTALRLLHLVVAMQVDCPWGEGVDTSLGEDSSAQLTPHCMLARTQATARANSRSPSTLSLQQPIRLPRTPISHTHVCMQGCKVQYWLNNSLWLLWRGVL